MEDDGTVLVLTQKHDTTADLVIVELSRLGESVTRFDISEFPLEASVVAELDPSGGDWSGHLARPTRNVEFGRVRSVWWRRPTAFAFPAGLTHEERVFARDEASAGIGGLLRGQDCYWMNHPEKAATADFKPLQLSYARASGFPVPRSLITNDPHRVRKFVQQNTERGRCTIYKTLAFPTVMNPVSGEEDVIYTTRITEGDVHDDTIRTTACLFQEEIPKALEIRSTVVGDQVLSAAIDARGSRRGQLDFRMGYGELKYAEHVLPPAVERRLVGLVRSLGLAFGAVDLILTEDGDYVFLEINPCGQWAWLEYELGLPIARSIADSLAGRPLPNGSHRASQQPEG